MSHSNDNRALVQGMYDAALGGDFEGFLKVMADDLLVHEPSFLPYGGVTRGKDNFVALFRTVCEYIAVSSIQVQGIVADGDHVVAFLTARTAGDNAELQLCEHSIVRDGKVTEMKIYYHEGASLIQGS